MMMFIDIGNSRIKFTLAHKPFHISAVPHQEVGTIGTQLLKKKISHLVVVCGHSQAATEALLALQRFAQTNDIIIEMVSVQPDLLAVNYADFSQFGTDRFLNLLAARNRFEKNICVVSCGTAITLDFYTNKHIGGMILPGLMVAQELLCKKTGLQQIARPLTLLGHDTATTIGAGIYTGLQNLIYSSIVRIEKEQNVVFNIILTGGDAQVLHQEGVIVDSLLFEGMSDYLYDRRNCHDHY